MFKLPEMPFDFPPFDFPSIDFSKLDVNALRNAKLAERRSADASTPPSWQQPFATPRTSPSASASLRSSERRPEEPN